MYLRLPFSPQYGGCSAGTTYLAEPLSKSSAESNIEVQPSASQYGHRQRGQEMTALVHITGSALILLTASVIVFGTIHASMRRGESDDFDLQATLSSSPRSVDVPDAGEAEK